MGKLSKQHKRRRLKEDNKNSNLVKKKSYTAERTAKKTKKETKKKQMPPFFVFHFRGFHDFIFFFACYFDFVTSPVNGRNKRSSQSSPKKTPFPTTVAPPPFCHRPRLQNEP